MGTLPGSPLGKATVYADRYDPALLYAVERAPQRDALGIGAPLPFEGGDAWTAWEGNWLDADGKPRVGVVRFDVPADSRAIVESKSVKLYFTALNDTRFAHASDYTETLRRDLSAATGAPVRVQLIEPDAYAQLARAEPDGDCLDSLALRAQHATPARAQLATMAGTATEALYTRLFRSVCPVTGQPDHATVQVAYRGPRIDRGSLFAYLVAYRRHPGFHEHCVERIFTDIAAACAPEALGVVAHFTRRGGIDISPWRRRGDIALAMAPTSVQ
ncbi:MAG TPA: NADPH-dependent 7-cyano-7-deazaguanine reductase QueF [Casimicrobiaceae bacterium]